MQIRIWHIIQASILMHADICHITGRSSPVEAVLPRFCMFCLYKWLSILWQILFPSKFLSESGSLHLRYHLPLPGVSVLMNGWRYPAYRKQHHTPLPEGMEKYCWSFQADKTDACFQVMRLIYDTIYTDDRMVSSISYRYKTARYSCSVCRMEQAPGRSLTKYPGLCHLGFFPFSVLLARFHHWPM